ncbi:MAG: hypothetical protein AB7P04_05525 [Bacteriovoracia bacterium]
MSQFMLTIALALGLGLGSVSSAYSACPVVDAKANDSTFGVAGAKQDAIDQASKVAIEGAQEICGTMIAEKCKSASRGKCMVDADNTEYMGEAYSVRYCDLDKVAKEWTCVVRADVKCSNQCVDKK